MSDKLVMQNIILVGQDQISTELGLMDVHFYTIVVCPQADCLINCRVGNLNLFYVLHEFDVKHHME